MYISTVPFVTICLHFADNIERAKEKEKAILMETVPNKMFDNLI